MRERWEGGRGSGREDMEVKAGERLAGRRGIWMSMEAMGKEVRMRRRGGG